MTRGQNTLKLGKNSMTRANPKKVERDERGGWYNLVEKAAFRVTQFMNEFFANGNGRVSPTSNHPVMQRSSETFPETEANTSNNGHGRSL